MWFTVWWCLGQEVIRRGLYSKKDRVHKCIANVCTWGWEVRIMAPRSQRQMEMDPGEPRPESAHLGDVSPLIPAGGLEGVGVPESLTRHQLPWRMSRTGPLGPKNPPAPSKEAGQAPPELPRERAEHSTAGPTNTHIPGGQKHPARSGDPGPDTRCCLEPAANWDDAKAHHKPPHPAFVCL